METERKERIRAKLRDIIDSTYPNELKDMLDPDNSIEMLENRNF